MLGKAASFAKILRMDNLPPRKLARTLIATYDLEDSGEYELEVVRIASSWQRILQSNEVAQSMVDEIVADLTEPTPEGFGIGWEQLQRGFLDWAEQNDYLGEVGEETGV